MNEEIRNLSERLRSNLGSADAWRKWGDACKELGNEAKAKADILKAEELEAKAKSKP